MIIRRALTLVLAGQSLERESAREVFAAAVDPATDPVRLGGLLCALAMRGESAGELAGAVDALRAAMTPFEHDHPDAVDTAGTGGDGLGSFNLSTAAALVAAAAGARVIKHGNRAVSSRCGSADLIEAAGVPLDLSPSACRVCLDEVGITFLMAPRYHPALAVAAPVRKALGVRTLFNLLGPLLNPGRVRRQVVGVCLSDKAPLLADVLSGLGHLSAYVVFGHGGADELTLSGPNQVHAVGEAPQHDWNAAGLGLSPAPVSALAGGDTAANLARLGRLMDGEAGPVTDAVLLNAGATLVVAGLAAEPAEGVARARDALSGGAARQTLERWRELAARLAREEPR